MAKSADLLSLLLAPEIRAWRGEQPLWKVFWLYGVAASCALAALYFGAMASGQILRQFLLLVLAVYRGWIVVSIWRCADKASEPMWGTLARFLTIAWAANALLVVTFLELDLVGTLIGK